MLIRDWTSAVVRVLERQQRLNGQSIRGVVLVAMSREAQGMWRTDL